MTFVDGAASPPSTWLVIAYAVLAGSSVLCTAQALHLGHTRLHYRNLQSVRFLLPMLCLISAVENATLASTKRYFQDDVDSHLYLQIVFVMQALEVPILLVVVFELCYVIHKRRSVNFCGMFFDEGRRVNKIITTPMKSFFLRNCIRFTAVILLVMGIVVNFDIMDDSTQVDDLAGRAGWWTLFRDNRSWSEKGHLLLSLVPTAILIVVCLYLSIVFWRYGTNSSMVVHSSYLNPWFSLFFGTAALAIGQFFSEAWYPLTSNIGLIVLIISVLLLMSEIDKDMEAAADFTDFLAQVAQKGDEVSVRNVPRDDGPLPDPEAEGATKKKKKEQVAGKNGTGRFGPAWDDVPGTAVAVPA